MTEPKLPVSFEERLRLMLEANNDIPLIFLLSLVPEAEKGDALPLLSATEALKGFVHNFGMAVKLFDLCSAEGQRTRAEPRLSDGVINQGRLVKLRMYAAWERIAARDGAIQIYHLGAVMRSIRKTLRESPTLCAMVDASKMKIATKLLESHFPNYELIRNAVAHSLYEIVPSSRLLQKHVVDQPVEIPRLLSWNGKTLVISDSLLGRNYIVTFKKKLSSYEISDASHAKLESVLKHFLAAFEPAREAFKRAQPSAAAQPPSS